MRLVLVTGNAFTGLYLSKDLKITQMKQITLFIFDKTEASFPKEPPKTKISYLMNLAYHLLLVVFPIHHFCIAQKPCLKDSEWEVSLFSLIFCSS